MKTFFGGAVFAAFAFSLLVTTAHADITTSDELQTAITNATSGDTITLDSDIAASSTITIDKSITIDGNGRTITAQAPITGSVVLITANDVTLSNLTVDANNQHVQGIQAYVVTNATLNQVTSKNAGKSGIMVNGSTVTVNDVTTSGNAWHGINIDQGSGVSTPAILTVNGTSSHNETGPAIFIDDTAKGSVAEESTALDQYGTTTSGSSLAYYPKSVTVSDESSFNSALSNSAIETINLSSSVNIASSVTISRPVSIVGNGATITGSVTVATSSVSVEGLSITNPSGNFGVIISGTSDVSVKSNTISDIGTSVSSGNSYGVYFQDSDSIDASNVEISGNTISAIGQLSTNASNGGIGIGDSTGSSVLSGFKINNNTISNINSGKGAYGILLNHANSGSQTGTTADATVNSNTISTLTGKWVHAIGLEGNTPHATVSSNTISKLTATTGTDIQSVYFEDNASEDTVTVSGTSYSGPTYRADVSTATSSPVVFTEAAEVNLTSGSSASTVTINRPVQSSISTSAGTVAMTIPQSAVITAAGSWDGTIALPHVSNQTITPSVGSNESASVALVINVGSDNSELTFDKAVRLVLPGQAGKRVGFMRPGETTFTEIPNECSVDTQETADTLGAGGECKIEVGSDLIVWTKHFTTFATYSVSSTANTNSSGSRLGGHSSGGGAVVATAAASVTSAPVGQVLGAESFRFSANLAQGMNSDAVTELQNRLSAAGYLQVSATGYFGPLTLAAVKAYQSANGIPATGFVGPLTIAQLNKDEEAPTTMTAPATYTGSSTSIKSFVELLISIGVISQDKAAAARTAVAAAN